MSSAFLLSRQNNGDLSTGSGDDRGVSFWWTREGVIVKWSIFFGLLFLFTLWLVGGKIHAKRRIKKGLKPLAYHRCLVSRAEMATVDPSYAYAQQPAYVNYAPAGPGGYYGMQPMPPPVYDPSRPPMYPGGGPPPMHGGSKIDPEQAAGDYAPPPGPPPSSAQRPERTGGSNNPFADPPRL